MNNYNTPTNDLLCDSSNKVSFNTLSKEVKDNKRKIISTFAGFKIHVDKILSTIGVNFTLYEISPQPGVRIARIKRLQDDIALCLGTRGVRIVAPLPNKNTIGIEVPNKIRPTLSLKNVIDDIHFTNSQYTLPIIIGQNTFGQLEIADLTTMPHLLIAGATGQGKSVGINVLLLSLLYTTTPDKLKLILIDPKKVELSLFKDIADKFFVKTDDGNESIIVNKDEAESTLQSLCNEMNYRYDILKDEQCKNIKEYNEIKNKGTQLPYIVLVIDELADLMLSKEHNIEPYIVKLSQLARAVGIHLVLSTQRPSVNVITGLIKANCPARIAYKASSQIDSRTILNVKGAEQLLGDGDLLFYNNNNIQRLQCPFVNEYDIMNVCEYIKQQDCHVPPYYLHTSNEDTHINLLNKAKILVNEYQKCSVNLLQQNLYINFQEAKNIIQQLENEGVIGPEQYGQEREVYILEDINDSRFHH